MEKKQNKMAKRTVLLTGGGGGGTIAICRSLQKTGRYRIIMADADAWAAGLLFGDQKYVIPYANAREFPTEILKIIKEESVDVLIPLVDEEIMPCIQLRKECVDVDIILPNGFFCRASLDKWQCMNELKKCTKDCITPWGLLCDSVDINEKLPFPLLVKPRYGRGSRGIEILKDARELGSFLEFNRTDLNNWVIQEYLEGTEYTVSVAVDKTNKLMGVVPKRVVYKRGVTITAYTEKVPVIDELCSLIVRQLKPCGPFNVQLVLCKDGNPRVFEINPRFSTTVALTIAAGFNEVDIIIRRNFGEEVSPPEIVWNLAMLRHWEQIYKPLAEINLK